VATWPDVVTARKAAAFLAEEEGCTSVASRLDGLIAAALSDSLDLETMGVPDQTALRVLSCTAESGDATALLGRSLAAYTAGAVERAEQVSDVLRTVGRQFLDRAEAGAWIATAAHRAGITFPPHRPEALSLAAWARRSGAASRQGADRSSDQSRSRGVQETYCRAKRKRLGGDRELALGLASLSGCSAPASFRSTLSGVGIHESARKHGVADEDIIHAVDYALVIEDAGEDPDRWRHWA
jgi:hypothetical protein